MAVMQGSSEPDQWILRGNHHDGWVFGAWDPLSGNVALLDEAKAIGTLAKTGWRPKRTLVYASWDARGTRSARVHRIRRSACRRTAAQGRGVHQFGYQQPRLPRHGRQPFAAACAQRGRRWRRRSGDACQRARTRAGEDARRRRVQQGAKPEDKENAKLAAKGGDLPIGALGSGSDYSAFLQHLGIASLNLGFSGEEDQNGVYHSRYDSFDHYVRFGDPDFAYGVALSKVAGHTVLRTGRCRRAAAALRRFQRHARSLRRPTCTKRSTACARTPRASTSCSTPMPMRWSPIRPGRSAPPVRDSDVPAIDLSPLDAASKRLKQSAQAFESAYDARAAAGFQGTPEQQREIDIAMARMEQALTDPDGLPGRGWYKHMIYAPGLLTGYDVKTVPGVREAIEQRRWDEANRYAAVTARVVDRYREQLDRLTELMKL